MKERLHIAIIDPVGKKAGMDQYNLFMGRGLLNTGVRVTVFSTATSADNDILVKRYFLMFLRSRYLQGLFALVGYLRSWLWCKRNSIDVVLFHIYHFSRTDYYILRWFRKSGFRVALMIHDVDPFRYAAPDARKRKILTEFTNYCFVHHATSRNELIQLIPGLRVTVVPHGHFIDSVKHRLEKAAARHLLGIPDGKICPLFFGMIKPEKGLDVLLDAFSFLDKRFFLLVAGRERGCQAKIAARVSSFVQQQRCRAELRYLSPEEMEVWMAAADLIVLPYRRIYQSGVAMQAMSRKIPLIVSDLPAFDDWKKNGLVRIFRDGDAKHLAQRIAEAAEHNDVSQDMAQKAFDYLREQHDWNIVGAEIVATIQS